MKFWYKTYLLTLLLFVLCLGASIFFIGYNSQVKTLEAEREKMVSRHSLIAQDIARSIKNIDGKTQRLEDFCKIYGTYYDKQGMQLAFVEKTEKQTIYSTMPFGPELPDMTGEKNVCSVFRQVEKKQYLYVVSVMNDSYLFVTCTDQTLVFENLKNDQMLYLIVFGGVSFLLAVVLFFTLKSLSQPVIRLASIADHIAGGRLEVRAKAAGKDEIAMLAKSLNNMADSLTAKMDELEVNAQQKERITDNLSHEMRTPLTAIQGYAEFIQIANLSERETREALQYIVKECMRLQKISSRMLQLSEMRRDEIKLAPTRLIPLVRSSAITVTAHASEKDVEFQLDAIPDVQVLCDEILLESLLNNLGDNAVKACQPGGKVQIHFQLRKEKLEIQIQDNGSGMTEEQLQKLGEPFYRPDKARSRKAGGAGLGIALCCEIAKLHNSGLVFQSAVGVGTKAVFQLEIATAVQAAEPQTRHEKPQ